MNGRRMFDALVSRPWPPVWSLNVDARGNNKSILKVTIKEQYENIFKIISDKAVKLNL